MKTILLAFIVTLLTSAAHAQKDCSLTVTDMEADTEETVDLKSIASTSHHPVYSARIDDVDVMYTSDKRLQRDTISIMKPNRKDSVVVKQEYGSKNQNVTITRDNLLIVVNCNN